MKLKTSTLLGSITMGSATQDRSSGHVRIAHEFKYQNLEYDAPENYARKSVFPLQSVG